MDRERAEPHSPEQQNQAEYFTIDELLAQIEGPNGEACRRLYADMCARFEVSPGSSHNHQAWPGGYIDHVTDAMNIGALLYGSLNARRPLPFPKSDVLLIVYLHDLEKPFRYTTEDAQPIEYPPRQSKDELEEFKRGIIQSYGIELTPQQSNALEYVEGIRDHNYTPHKRMMSELGAVCHMADLLSARLWYDYPKAEDDSWQGAQRANPAAAGITLPSEWYPET